MLRSGRQVGDFIGLVAHEGGNALGKIASFDILGGAPQPPEGKRLVAAEQQAEQRTYKATQRPREIGPRAHDLRVGPGRKAIWSALNLLLFAADKQGKR
jgi:hypothetical protein